MADIEILATQMKETSIQYIIPTGDEMDKRCTDGFWGKVDRKKLEMALVQQGHGHFALCYDKDRPGHLWIGIIVEKRVAWRVLKRNESNSGWIIGVTGRNLIDMIQNLNLRPLRKTDDRVKNNIDFINKLFSN